jgi:hypothetical protein
MDLLTVLAKNFPGVQAHITGMGENYTDLVWEGGLPLPSEADLLAAHLSDHKVEKITELSKDCARDIISGFVSSALGSEHIYDSDGVDQLNILGSYVATTPDANNPQGSQTYHAVRAIIDGEVQLKEYKLHDNLQMKKVVLDGVAFKLKKLTRFNAMRNEILVNTEMSMEELDAVTWQSGIPGVVE